MVYYGSCAAEPVLPPPKLRRPGGFQVERTNAEAGNFFDMWSTLASHDYECSPPVVNAKLISCPPAFGICDLPCASLWSLLTCKSAMDQLGL